MKNWYLLVFGILVAAQWYVPGKMVLESETLLREGKAFKFRLAPVDPTDPFRGKYIALNYHNSRYNTSTLWTRGDDVFVELAEDEEGFAKIIDLSPVQPNHTNDYIKATVRSYYEWDETVIISYPFDRYYLEESIAYPAEEVFRQLRRDSNTVAYGLISIKNGSGVLSAVILNDRPIEELAREWRDRPQPVEE